VRASARLTASSSSANIQDSSQLDRFAIDPQIMSFRRHCLQSYMMWYAVARQQGIKSGR
jgi:hypothetical protein